VLIKNVLYFSKTNGTSYSYKKCGLGAIDATLWLKNVSRRSLE